MGPSEKAAEPVLARLGPCRAGVCGSPVEHSFSPLLHRAAYRALGLTDWSYHRARIEADQLAGHVAGLDETWRGLSLTMPLKEAAFGVVHTASPLAVRVGAINTLVRDDRGWWGENTDVHGIVEALRAVGVRHADAAVLVGAGATARSALAALVQLGVRRVTFIVRDRVRPETSRLAEELGLDVAESPMGVWPEVFDVVVGTVPAVAYHRDRGPAGMSPVEALPRAVPGSAVLDCVYGDGPSPLLQAADSTGYAVVPGTEMLLHQAAEQVRLMTGRQPPVPEMRHALAAAVDATESGTRGSRR
ncbi:MAG: shikimate dehydrogenase [Actinomycetales bacterium]|nr:MAG: shikimate dehydrogenase [Actinomycetales bacterium]